jgi:hypothetical protein
VYLSLPPSSPSRRSAAVKKAKEVDDIAAIDAAIRQAEAAKAAEKAVEAAALPENAREFLFPE